MRMRFPISNLCGQTYDGASKFGYKLDVAKQIKNGQPKYSRSLSWTYTEPVRE